MAPVTTVERLDASSLTETAEIRVNYRPSGHFVCHFAEVGDGAVGSERQLPQLLEHFPIGRHLPFLRDASSKQVPSCLQVEHVIVPWIEQLHDHERPRKARVGTGAEGNDLDRHVRPGGEIDQMVDLTTHDVPAAYQ